MRWQRDLSWRRRVRYWNCRQRYNHQFKWTLLNQNCIKYPENGRTIQISLKYYRITTKLFKNQMIWNCFEFWKHHSSFTPQLPVICFRKFFRQKEQNQVNSSTTQEHLETTFRRRGDRFKSNGILQARQKWRHDNTAICLPSVTWSVDDNTCVW